MNWQPWTSSNLGHGRDRTAAPSLGWTVLSWIKYIKAYFLQDWIKLCNSLYNFHQITRKYQAAEWCGFVQDVIASGKNEPDTDLPLQKKTGCESCLKMSEKIFCSIGTIWISCSELICWVHRRIEWWNWDFWIICIYLLSSGLLQYYLWDK